MEGVVGSCRAGHGGRGLQAVRDVGAQDIEDSCLNSLMCRGSALYMVGTSAWQ